MKTFRELVEGKFEVLDVMGHEYYIVTDGKEIAADTGEIKMKPKDNDLWANKGKKYKDFLMSKKDAESFAKEMGSKFKAVKVTTQNKN